MALTKCKECGAEISKQATSCPKCGAKRLTRSQIGCLAVVVIFALIIIVAFIATDSDVPEMNADVARNNSENAILVTNKNDFTWYGLKATVNGEYQNNFIDKLSWEPGETIYLYYSALYDSTGTRFNWQTQVVLGIELRTRQTPDGDYDVIGSYTWRN